MRFWDTSHSHQAPDVVVSHLESLPDRTFFKWFCSCGAEGSVTDRSSGCKYQGSGTSSMLSTVAGAARTRAYGCLFELLRSERHRPTQKGGRDSCWQIIFLASVRGTIKALHTVHRLSRTRRLTWPANKSMHKLRQGPESMPLSRDRRASFSPL